MAIRTRGDEFTITWGELRERVDALARGLAGLGLGHGRTVALMLSNRPEFHICDLAAMMLGATPFSIYNTYTADQIAYIVGDADASMVICRIFSCSISACCRACDSMSSKLNPPIKPQINHRGTETQRSKFLF